MSYAQGLKLGYSVIADAGRELRAGAALGRERRMKNEIGKILAAEDAQMELTEGGKPDTDLAVKQAKESGFQMAPSAPAATGFQMAPSASAQQAPGVAPAPIPQQAFKPEEPRGLQMPQMQSPMADVVQKEQMAAAAEKPRTTVDPMSAAKKYQKAAAVAAQYGDLELQQAYSETAKRNFQTGMLRLTGAAVSGLRDGETKPFLDLMNKYISRIEPYTFENAKVDPTTGSVTYDVVGEGGARSKQTMTEKELMERALLAADEKFIDVLYKNSVAAEATREEREHQDKVRKENQSFQKEMQNARLDDAWKRTIFSNQEANKRQASANAARIQAENKRFITQLTKEAGAAYQQVITRAGISDPLVENTIAKQYQSLVNSPNYSGFPQIEATQAVAFGVGVSDSKVALKVIPGGVQVGNVGVVRNIGDMVNMRTGGDAKAANSVIKTLAKESAALPQVQSTWNTVQEEAKAKNLDPKVLMRMRLEQDYAGFGQDLDVFTDYMITELRMPSTVKAPEPASGVVAGSAAETNPFFRARAAIVPAIRGLEQKPYEWATGIEQARQDAIQRGLQAPLR